MRVDEQIYLPDGMTPLDLDVNAQKRLAKQWSDGSTELEKMMIELWGKGIATVFSCSGIEEEHPNHKERGVCAEAHVIIDLSAESLDFVSSFLQTFSEEDLKTFVLQMTKDNYKGIERNLLEIAKHYTKEDIKSGKMLSCDESNEFFANLSAVMERGKDKVVSTEMGKAFCKVIDDMVGNRVGHSIVVCERDSISLGLGEGLSMKWRNDLTINELANLKEFIGDAERTFHEKSEPESS